MNWIEAALQAIEGGKRAALVSVVRAAGSTPRETGAKMLVFEHGIDGSIGGGQLEFEAIQTARRMMAQGEPARRLVRQILGPDLGQCCGGAVSLLVEALGTEDRKWLSEVCRRQDERGECWLLTPERGAKSLLDTAGARAIGWSAGESTGIIPGSGGWRVIERVWDQRPPVWIFGAGHVGRALAQILNELPFRVTLLDSRDGVFGQDTLTKVEQRLSRHLAEEVQGAPAGAIYLVMTHSHSLDYDICERILRRGDFRFLGLIGSSTKSARFRRRFKERGLPANVIDRLTCPIGLTSVVGKEPMAIAVGVAGQLLALREALNRDQGRDTDADQAGVNAGTGAA